MKLLIEPVIETWKAGLKITFYIRFTSFLVEPANIFNVCTGSTDIGYLLICDILTDNSLMVLIRTSILWRLLMLCIFYLTFNHYTHFRASSSGKLCENVPIRQSYSSFVLLRCATIFWKERTIRRSRTICTIRSDYWFWTHCCIV